MLSQPSASFDTSCLPVTGVVRTQRQRKGESLRCWHLVPWHSTFLWTPNIYKKNSYLISNVTS